MFSKPEERSNSDASTKDSGVRTPVQPHDMEKPKQQPAEAPQKMGGLPSPQAGDTKAMALILPSTLLVVFLVSLVPHPSLHPSASPNIC